MARSSERDQLDTQAQALRGEVEALTREKEKLSGDVSDIRNTLGTYATSIETISAAKDRAQEDAAEKESARRDAVDAQMAAEAAMRDAQDAQAQAERMLADLQAELETRRIELAHNEAIFATLRAQGVAIDNVAMPDIDAAVLDVRMDLAPGLVVLNVGADSNVQRGFVFDAYNGRTYKGRVRVENVDATMCSALIIGTADNASIQRGDRASTHI